MSLELAIKTIRSGGLIAYPTEAVYGLGCDPDNQIALQKLIALKQRCASKGVILIAANYQQLLPYIDEQAISSEQQARILSRWPAAITQILPAKPTISTLLTGGRNTIAVRVTNHPQVIQLCEAINKPLVSTSANVSGEQELTTYYAVKNKFNDKLDYILAGETLGFAKPSQIIDGISGKVYR